MASYIELKLLRILYISLLTTTEISFIVGLITHVFIITVNAMEWRKGRAISTSDQVIVSIMMSRMLLQSVIQLNLISDYLCAMCSPVYNLAIRFICFCTLYSCIWLSTLLCVVFQLKILNVHSVFFLWLRRIFSNRILLLIISCLLVSIGQTSMIYLYFFIADYYDASMNSTHVYAIQSIDTALVMSCVNMVVPLLIFVLSSLLLITSLHLHIQQMRSNTQVTTSLDAYYRIIKYTAGSLFMSVLSVIISALAETYYYMLGFVLFAFSWTTFGTLHSILLIYVTPKLKNPFSGMLKFIYDCFIKREEPRDLVATVTT